ncbi:MAG TPA: hypothetical protein VJ876_05750 [Bacteroidales bacterium]|nr:hypothetical protein [Bacteroidales bacterium]
MRTIFVLLLFFFSLPMTFSQLPEALEKNTIIEQDIESQEQWNYKFVDGKPSDKGYKNSYREYDLNGNTTKEEYYRRGDINQELSYKYDRNQNKTEYVNYSAEEDEIRFKQTIEYDQEGRKIKENRYNGSEHHIIDYTYDDGERLSSIVKTDLDGNLIQKRIFSYDGNVANIRVLNGEGNMISRIVNKYDDRENLIEHIEYTPEGEQVKKISYSFNDKDLKTDEVKHQKGNFIYHKQYKYNDADYLVEIHKEQPREEENISKKFHYAPDGKLSKEEWYDSMADKYSHRKYYYNKKGIVEKAEVYYALYDYKVLYRYRYTFH